ncbi:hypothetical protein LT978_16390 [Bacillus amyloliquefaciens]|uniref:hypothetical protein n=1 Tax=Bacillus TaxID=1386 RepID=UPI0002458D7B|nr:MULTISPECIES: hypothetical protein [Bacillus amyloliquefaciens group]KJD58258.1 hypothetical protein UZ38_08755 [Bacillus amyloliquefaciens]PKF85417.1 hypothetical protein CWI74_00920 [Bacillus velezensis]RDY83778.1 hypothetical protein C3733_18765 [Bacillus amyloliquefaciens]USP43569.1 hypothetical protein LT978_16055 [Bacillus amyloliquefaciens]USP43632.1 hypothetical protein LT978_16390 [Bacillus amyloliquefaciens]
MIKCTCRIESFCNHLHQLILEINQLHSDFSTNFSLKQDVKHVHLKKTQIRHVTEVTEKRNIFSIDNDFFILLQHYADKLEDIVIYNDLEYLYSEFDLRLRVKQPDSIVNKLKYYRVGKKESGQIALRKCLNDLLGIRITIDSFDHNNKCFQDMCELLKKQYKINCMDSSKGDYKAFHFYFYGESTFFFPWELQIWRTDDKEANNRSHQLHKQAYKGWASIYKNSTEVEK